MIVSPDGALADQLGVKHLGHEDVGAPLHVKPGPNLQLCGTLPDKLDLSLETILFYHLVEVKGESKVHDSDCHLLGTGCHG